MQHLRRSFRYAAAGAALGLALVACGQKPGVHVGDGSGGDAVAGQDLDQSGETGGGGATAPDGSGGADVGSGATGGGTTGGASGGSGGSAGTGGGATGGTSGGGTGGSGDTGSGGGTTGSGDTGAGGGTSDSGDGTSAGSGGDGSGGAGGGGTRQPQGSDRTGASDQTITLGIHAPVTGAAPLPAQSFREARDLYWRWQIEQQNRTILGREDVEVLFRDDKYNPNSAVQVCREMAAESFLLVGGGGTDQIQACGRFSGEAQVPYFSAGVTEAGLEDNPWYFATSMTYRQQGILLAQYMASNPHGQLPDDGQIAAVITDTQNFDDAVAGFEQGIEQAGLGDRFFGVRRHPKGDTSWYTSYAQDFQDAGVSIIYPLTAPVDYIRFAQQASDQGYNPTYAGVGVSMGLNAVLSGGCGDPGTGIDNGVFFSPFPGLDWARQNEGTFFDAAEQFGTVSDDLALALWGIAKQEDIFFQRYAELFGNDLTREDFRAFVEAQSSVQTNLFPEVGYSPDDHFGGKQVHVLEADCTDNEHNTLATFASSF